MESHPLLGEAARQAVVGKYGLEFAQRDVLTLSLG